MTSTTNAARKTKSFANYLRKTEVNPKAIQCIRFIKCTKQPPFTAERLMRIIQEVSENSTFQLACLLANFMHEIARLTFIDCRNRNDRIIGYVCGKKSIVWDYTRLLRESTILQNEWPKC
ncbi:hypothetical protein AVEN_54407-1 [Araneus ventricosus]|uniref:Uncharacterized protein n=1 Tax=Araneus ventricosus TaxID=182803 RepID=A0A4Y2DBJ0_ARAVE|nr:hypothetical protein AVEN_54407-1 [Araneus ventricosus]